MSIKKLFDDSDSSRHYTDSTDQRNLFKEVESVRNVEAIQLNKDTYEAPIEYAKPENFARYGSAYLYYKGAFERVLDFYPYDGSDAEINEFVNKADGIDRYIFNEVYPRTTGYITLSPNTTSSADGYGSTTVVGNGAADWPSNGDGQPWRQNGWYSMPSSEEYITFDGGPGTGSFASGSSLVTLSPNPTTSKFQFANIYDEDIYTTAGLPIDYGSGSRESNLKTDLDTNGIAIEFWLKTGSYDDWDSALDGSGRATWSGRQVIFDMWNHALSGSGDYARLTLELTGGQGTPGQWDVSPFRLTVQSGTAGGGIFDQRIGASTTTRLASSSFGEWNHWAFNIYQTGSSNRLRVETYLNGYLHHTDDYTTDAIGELNPKNMQGRIGALLTAPSGAAELAAIDPSQFNGAGKLSGSLDEFRFWKAKRTPREIGLKWFTQVRGGVNTDIHNTELGVYYKFNEGITGIAATDSVVLDFGGRIANGAWTGYNPAFSRNTGSAMVSASAVAYEYEDPIIYADHPDVSSSLADHLELGEWYDSTNNSMFKNYMPAWILDEHINKSNSNLDYLAHIMGSYFDKLHYQIAALPLIKAGVYPTGSFKPIPFAKHLPQSLGLYTPEIFIDATIIEQFLDRDETIKFQNNRQDTKNLIYTNLYHNLAHIYKSKGTERAIRNVFRCFNMDENIAKLNVYAKNSTFELKNNLQETISRKKHLNLNDVDNLGAVVYQRQDPLNGESSGYISGSNGAGDGYENRFGATVEGEFTFPRIHPIQPKFDRNYHSVSLFGCHTPDSGSADSLSGVDTGVIADDFAFFRVTAEKLETDTTNISFKLTSSAPGLGAINLTSSIFYDIYDDQRWNLSVRVKPTTPLAQIVTGATDSGNAYGYDVIFRGVSTGFDSINQQFQLTASVSKEAGENFLNANKRLYAGATRTNITGAVEIPCDVYVTSLKYWAKAIDNLSLNQHIQDYDNSGIEDIYQQISPFAPQNLDISNQQMLGLNWSFANVTSSNVDGTFYSLDMSSGSAFIRGHYGWLGNIAGYQHTGYGTGFATSSTEVVDNRLVNSYKLMDPERVVSSDMIKIMSDDDRVYGIEQRTPSFFYALEKSLHSAITEEMLDFFAGVVDFNNLIGEPVNRYRERYKGMEKLRETFFRRVSKVSTVEQYLSYYKWFDESLTTIIGQLVPATVDYLDGTLNVIESHVLERNKYKTPYPTLEFVAPDLDAAMEGIEAGAYDWQSGHSARPSSPRSQRVNGPFWKKRALRTSIELTALNEWPADSALADTIDSQKETIRKTINSAPHMSQSHPSRFTTSGIAYENNIYAHRNFMKLYQNKVDLQRPLKGGANFEDDKNFSFIYDAVRPAGPVGLEGDMYIPQNVLIGLTDDLVKLQELEMLDANPTGKKIKRTIKVQHGRHWQDGQGYFNVKSSKAFPFSIYSSSVKTGYNATVVARATASIEITNLHNDVYGPDLEIPMQGPFTEHVVGGHQSRHVKLNRGEDRWYNRPEAWKILLGKCPNTLGAIGLAGPDYPWPEANEEDVAPYPMTASQKAWLYRDFVSKSPVNVKNIRLTTGSDGVSTVLGNYAHNYDIINTVGAYSNPRWFVDHQPALPTRIFGQSNLTSSNFVANYLLIGSQGNLDEPNHFNYGLEYLVTDNSSSENINNSIITSRFGAPGARETTQRSFRDIRGGEFSVYNVLGHRNWGVIKPSQGPTGAVAAVPRGIRAYDYAGQDFGFRAHAARHTARFGRDSMLVPNPGASYDQIGNFHKVHRNNITLPKQECTLVYDTSDVDLPDWRNTCTTTRRQVYDNLNVSHMIPRMDRQYSWVTGSLEEEGAVADALRFYGRAPVYGILAGLYSSSTEGYVAYFNYETDSDVTAEKLRTLEQPTSRLNILTNDPVSSSANILGYPLSNAYDTAYTEQQALREKLGIAVFTGAGSYDWLSGSTNYLNLLLTRRGGTFGWNWKSTRQQQHPILLKEKEDNKISVITSEDATALSRYRLAPVSMRGRPVLFNYTRSGNTVTLKSTHNNEEIFFNETSLDNFAEVSAENVITPYEQLVPLIQSSTGTTLNWVLYTENLFPSLRNEFSSSVRGKPTFDNKYWRDSQGARIDIGDDLPNSFGVVSINQDCWPLSAQSDFLTRTEVPEITDEVSINNLRQQGKAGELQNNYFHHFKSADQPQWAYRALSPAGLYARKHLIETRGSVVAPFGVPIAQTASIAGVGPYGPGPDPHTSQFDPATYIRIYAGEAYWDAPVQAGIIKTSGSNSVFEAHASKPWFNNYDDFSYDIKTVAKDFAVVPEFRISEHIETYVKNGIFNEGNLSTFSIPETGIDSSTGSFYIDYSNSEFMKNFLKVKADTFLNAAEISINVSAAIRLNPYKGFYPAQRTLDLVNQFSRSYGSSLSAKVSYTATTTAQSSGSSDCIYVSGALARPVGQVFFAPGILYNTIKSGMAVDYPILSTNGVVQYGGTGIATWYGVSASAKVYTSLNTGDETATSTYAMSMMNGRARYNVANYWDQRIPFEAIINPASIGSFTVADFEPHPSASLNMTGAFAAEASDNIYNLMARNFFGEVPNFFLKDSGLTKIESGVIRNDMTFESGSTYACRIKLRKSYTGTKSYENESGSAGPTSFTSIGGGAYVDGTYSSDVGYPLPQWPINKNPGEFQETFTMYSRPSAFGPAISGRPVGQSTPGDWDKKVRDSFNGFNPAYTPPYYDGEAWLDVVFRPSASVSYDLDKILAESSKAYWRFDAGNGKGQLLYTTPTTNYQIYDGYRINPNSMQLSASINPFGVEPVNFQETDKFGNVMAERDTVVGKRWVIQPKFETPMLNFNNLGTHGVTGSNGNFTCPQNFGATAPRGMWHQFGTIPDSPDVGVFLEVEDIPSDWLRYHPEVTLTGSLYNNYDVTAGAGVVDEMKSLKDLMGFGKTTKSRQTALGIQELAESSERLGELAESRTIREAIVAIPYVIRTTALLSDYTANAGLKLRNSFDNNLKQFINIPQERYEAALSFAKGTEVGDSLMTSGESIRKLIQKMERYVLPPQFDFLNNPSIDPIVMYMFEFEYTFDKDDLSYMWQNLAPRNYRDLTFQHQSIAHELMDLELLDENVLMDNENLRWMVFKVKQRAQTDYYDLVQTQAGEGSMPWSPVQSAQASQLLQPFNRNVATSNSTYPLRFNWPYDYISFVELIKVDAQILYKDTSTATGPLFGQGPIVFQPADTQTVSSTVFGATNVRPTFTKTLLTNTNDLLGPTPVKTKQSSILQNLTSTLNLPKL